MKKFLFVITLLLSLTVNAQKKPLQPTGLMMENIEYPFAVKRLPLKIQGQDLQMAYMDLVPKKPNGKIVMLLHGKNFPAMYWEETAKDLSKDGYRVIMPDQIGFGKSSKAGNIQYTFQLLAQNTKALLDTLKIEKVNVVGHSMGGMLATRFSLMYPQTVEKLVLENPIGLEDWKTVVPYQSVDEWYESELKQDYKKMKEYQLKFYYDNDWDSDYDKWLLPVAGWTVNKEYAVIAKSAALTYDMIFTQPVCYEFKNLTMPVLLIIGQRDRTALGKAKAPKEVQETLGNYPELGKQTARKIENCRLAEIEGAGHLPHIEVYNKFIGPLKEFLK